MSRENEIKERLIASGLVPLKVEVRSVKEDLTDEERESIAKEIDGNITRWNDLENQKKDVNKALGDEIKKVEETIKALSGQRTKGFITEDQECYIAADMESRIRRVISLKSGIQVGTEMIQDSDYQTKMPLGEKPTTKAPEAPKTEGPLEIGYEPVEDSEEPQIVGDDEGGMFQTESIVTQIRQVETSKGAPGVLFATTAEGTVLFTEDKGFMGLLAQAQESRGYLAIQYEASETRNKRIIDCEYRDIDPEVEDNPRMDLIEGTGIEIAEDIP